MDYKEITYKDIEDLFTELSKPTNNYDRGFTVMTGYRGMMEFDLMMMFHYAGVIGSFTIKYYWGGTTSRNTSFDKLRNNKNRYIRKLIDISLVEKSGMWKLRFYKDKKLPLHLYYGTNLIIQTNNLEDLNKYINGK